MILTLIAIAAAQAAPAPAASQPQTDEARFQACSTLARNAPERAIDEATRWRVEGGRLYARQCLGLAFVRLERWAPAATVYEQAAREAETLQDPRRADLWAQSGNAWLAAGEGAKAVQAFDSALATTNLTDAMRGEVHLDRARALVALGNSAGGRTDLDRALQLVPADPMAWYLSAALAARGRDLPRAQTDIARALQLAPRDPDVVLLAGTIAGLVGNGTDAERLYRQVAEQAPGTDAGRAARAALDSSRPVTTPAPAPAPPPSPPR